MDKIIFILGGARSGKSSYAIELAKKEKNVLFAATASPSDSEMKKRIEKHKKSRPKNFKTVEIKKELSEIFKENFKAAIIDCLTIFVAGKMVSGRSEQKILAEIKKFLTEIKNKNKKIIIVSNEVGGGIIPRNKLARKFRDVLGNTNRMISGFSDKVYLMTAGIPILIKGDSLLGVK
ncbi:MAG: bifunctional adenosylcobinamide kinase/adenosylcobinamide-phosphate guanylyltransferase [Elusimicrobia bacterium]|nr:bifunctional adenosylcobinamide kinase/adenosylcobinamide-phosphate guanylyltransferase [Elusimicrobiota bacterium]